MDGVARDPVYLDHQATTPLDPEVWDAMIPYFGPRFGNAASRHHAYGREAEEAVKRAREQVAAALGASPEEIVWTSGATEASNLALKGVCEHVGFNRSAIVTSRVEHQATLDTCRYLASRGVDVSYLPNDSAGIVEFAGTRTTSKGQTILLSLIHGNNEIGTLQDAAAAAAFAAEHGFLLHLDAAQTFGKVPLDAGRVGFDLASISSHKLYGPKGVGALFVRRRARRLKLSPLIHGGGHERGFRSGTLNVPAIVGFGMAAEVAMRRMAEDGDRIRVLRGMLLDVLRCGLEGVRLNGHHEARLAGNLNVVIEGVESESLLMALHDVAISNGSACSSVKVEASHVLLACGLDPQEAFSSIRVGIGRYTTEGEVRFAAKRIVEESCRLRDLQRRF